MTARVPSSPRLGLAANWRQFSLLVLVNAFVGGMVGLERSILPALAEREFHLAARTAILSFIVVFGIVKALTNYLAGDLSDRRGRQRVLVAGWIAAVPVPFLLMWAWLGRKGRQHVTQPARPGYGAAPTAPASGYISDGATIPLR